MVCILHKAKEIRWYGKLGEYRVIQIIGDTENEDVASSCIGEKKGTFWL